ncbi:MAG: 2Fe-2S iron-sulfur cluster-binding protein [Gammaproteobacteria bacterium]
MSIKRFIQSKIKPAAGKSDDYRSDHSEFKVTLFDEEYSCRAGETVLDALLRQKADVPYACRQQVCHSCLMRSLNGAPPPEAQQNLRDTLKSLDYFLACACVPTRNMEIVPQDNIVKELAATVVQKEKLAARVLSITLRCAQPMDYRAGQTVILMNSDKQGKSYHISSVSSEKESGIIEIHAALTADSFFSEWLSSELASGDDVTICGPMGHHFYIAEPNQRPLLFIADGFGLSPLIGILQDALEAGDSRPVYFYHSAKCGEDLYLVDDLCELANYCPSFFYQPSTLNRDEKFTTGSAGALALQNFAALNDFRVYICGSSFFVKQTQKDVYLKGAATKDIYSIFLSQ